MSWFKVDDKLWGHPKWLAISPRARSLWVSAGSWCSDHLTDGIVPRHVITAFGARPKDAAELVAVGLWTTCEQGWSFRDWSDYQPSKESVLAERESARQRQMRARDAARTRREQQQNEQRSNGVSHGVTSHEVPTVSQAPRPDPTRPVVPTELQDTTPSAEQPPSNTPRTTTPKEHPLFAEFWSVYPRKVGKDGARKVFTTAARRLEDPSVIIAGAIRFRDDRNRSDEFTPHPSTWLNAGRWDDEPEPPRGGPRPGTPRPRYGNGHRVEE